DTRVPSGVTVSATTRSSSWSFSCSPTPTQNSSGVASIDPSTRPTFSGPSSRVDIGEITSESGTDSLPEYEVGQTTSNQPRIPQPAAEMRFERADGQQILWSPRIAAAARYKSRQQNSDRISE